MSEATTPAAEANVTPQRAKGATKPAPSTKKATPKKGAPKGKKAAKKQPAAKAKAAKPKASSREGSKKAIILDMLRRPKGATLKEIMSATQWQAHSVRGFISAALGKKMGIKVESTRRDDGERLYKVI
jgi:Protein of unknown function (DUF3489)